MSTFSRAFDLGNDENGGVIFADVLGSWWVEKEDTLPTPSVVGMMSNEVGRKLEIGKVYMTGYAGDYSDGAIGHLLYVGDTW